MNYAREKRGGTDECVHAAEAKSQSGERAVSGAGGQFAGLFCLPTYRTTVNTEQYFPRVYIFLLPPFCRSWVNECRSSVGVVYSLVLGRVCSLGNRGMGTTAAGEKSHARVGREGGETTDSRVPKPFTCFDSLLLLLLLRWRWPQRSRKKGMFVTIWRAR